MPALPPDVSALQARLHDLLQTMDRQATTTFDGYPTGLSYFGGHARPELKRPHTEVEWSRRLAELLTLDGFNVNREVGYPDSRKRCDLVVALPSGPCWIEVKGAWRDYWLSTGNLGIYNAYLHSTAQSPQLGKTHSLALDFQKLSTLTSPTAAHAMLVLVGFDLPNGDYPKDIALFLSQAPFTPRSPPHVWSPHATTWTSHHHPNQQTHVHSWTTPCPPPPTPTPTPQP